MNYNFMKEFKDFDLFWRFDEENVNKILDININKVGKNDIIFKCINDFQNISKKLSLLLNENKENNYFDMLESISDISIDISLIQKLSNISDKDIKKGKQIKILKIYEENNEFDLLNTEYAKNICDIKAICSDYEENEIFIPSKFNKEIKNGDIIKVIKYPTDGKVLHLKARLLDGITTAIINKENFNYLNNNEDNILELILFK